MSSPTEHLPVVIAAAHVEIAQRIARRIAELIRSRIATGEPVVLGLATGSTPIGIYRELIRQHREEQLDFGSVVTFNLDEYFPMAPGSPHSYHRYMWENFFQHVNVRKEHVHLPRGDVPRDAVAAHAAEYEDAIRRVGGIDFLILGIGQTGHIGFNEPGSGAHSRTRLVTLDSITRRTAAADFFGEDNVPLEAITMGVATILEAREIALIATGEHKAAVVRRAVEGDVDPDVAASYLQRHPRATFHLDRSAAAELARLKTPWVLGDLEWTPPLEIQALVWLSEVTGKSVLKLDARDYREHGLASLLVRGGAGSINGRVFNALTARIRGRSRLPRERRIIVFSPHPDDDVISAAGILRKLHQNRNSIVVAYQTSGNLAVFDHEVRRYLDVQRRLAEDFELDPVRVGRFIAEVEASLAVRQPGDADSMTVRQIKRRIREAEAVSGIETLGLSRDQARFLDLPFYRTGLVRKDPIGDQDVEIVRALLDEIRPDLVLAAGDLSDPHGTHRMCLEVIQRALAGYTGDPPDVWYYRGAWQEWPVPEADVLVPLSEEELRLKIFAIFKHQSQKDKAPFPGVDEREFWQRVDERNRATAAVLDRLGLPEYCAIEAYVIAKGEVPAGDAPPSRTRS